jgi:hypothetical protein
MNFMLLNQAAHSGDGKLRRQHFFIPRLDRLDTSECLPLSIIVFVSQFRPLFDAEEHVPKLLDLAEFGYLADYLHILALGETRQTWTFERFAPFSAVRVGVDLSGAEVNDPRFEPFNQRLDAKLARLLREKVPFYVGTDVDEMEGERVAHRLLIPMSDVGRRITHCLLMSV